MKRSMQRTKYDIARSITEQSVYLTDSGMRQKVMRDLQKLSHDTLRALESLIGIKVGDSVQSR